MTIAERCDAYARAFPKNAASHLRVVQEQGRDVAYGRWVIGNDIGARPNSVVNSWMTHDQALGILSAAIASRDDAEIVGSRWERPRSDLLLARNILRECKGKPVSAPTPRQA